MDRSLWLVLMLVLAGCAEPPAPAEADDPLPECAADEVCGQDGVSSEDGRDLRTDLLATDTLQAPAWQVGDVFEQHLFLGARDASGQHIQTVVVDTQGTYTIETTDAASARYEAVYDLPILGQVGKGLETTAFGSDWSWMYAFPLSDGKTWTGAVEGLLNWNTYSFTDHALTMTASYDGAINTPKGDLPGFWIEAVNQDDDLLARYNYVPAIGWFSHLWMYDLDNGGDETMFHAMSMGTSKNFTGLYVTATAEAVLEHFQGVFPDPAGPVQGDVTPQDFTVPDSDRFMGIIVPIAVGGQMEVTLTRPDGSEKVYGYQNLATDGQSFDVVFLDDQPVPGDWNMRAVGVGVATGAYVWLNAVTVGEGRL